MQHKVELCLKMSETSTNLNITVKLVFCCVVDAREVVFVEN